MAKNAVLPGGTELDTCKEEFSYAFIAAVATISGFACSRSPVDNVGVDLRVRGPSGDYDEIGCDLQVKCTNRKDAFPAREPDVVRYWLDWSDYRWLTRRGPGDTPIYLIIVAVPREPVTIVDWLRVEPTQLLLAAHAYWGVIAKDPSAVEGKSVKVDLQKSNLLTPAAISTMSVRIST